VSHTRILYRQFLFRLMDVEFLAASARGDASQLFGQFASMLVFISFVGAYGGLIAGSQRLGPEMTWLAERILIEATMLVVGIFALLSWESTFPDRRDVYVISPLPVRGKTIFIAKVAAAASSLGLTVLALHCLAGLTWPGALMPRGAGFLAWLRCVAAYWITLPAAGAFLYCAMLGLQGIVGLLPRPWFLRISSFLQIGAFALFLGVIFLQPSLMTTKALAAPENQRALAWLPDYWFMGLFNVISGQNPHPALSRLADRAIIGFAIALLIALVAFVLSWLRTMRKIAEEPDILPSTRGGLWLPRFGSSPQTALVQFTLRTLGRSRQHRMNLAFYLGVGFGYKLPALVTELNGKVRILAHGRVDTTKKNGLRNTFEFIPDAPISRIVLEMKGGKKYGLLENSENLCAKTQRANARLIAQNGVVDQSHPQIAIQCKKKTKARKGHR